MDHDPASAPAGDIGPIGEDDLADFVTAEYAAFGEPLPEGRLELIRKVSELDRALAVRQDGRIVATAGALSWEITVPGLALVPAAAVTAVTVLPTHRRRGLLTRLMARQLEDIARRGEPLAVLICSETTIYGRFGYGLSTRLTGYRIDTRDAAFARPFSAPGELVLLDRGAAPDTVPGVYDHIRRSQPGALSRSAGWWTYHFGDPETSGPLYYVVHRGDGGRLDGFVSYRMKLNESGGVSAHELEIQELQAVDPLVRAALWHYCLNVDLVGTVAAPNSAVDEALPWMLADSRRLGVTRHSDWLWVRILDVPRALAARSYSAEGVLVIEVEDAFRPASSGRYRLEATGGQATCRVTDAAPDMAVGVAELGSLYLGGVRATTLAAAGRVEGRRPGAMALADALFASDPAPFDTSDF